MKVGRAIELAGVCLLLISTLLSCGNKMQPINLSDLDKVQTISLFEPRIIAKGFINPSDIISFDTLIFISDRYSEDMIQVYSIDGQYIRGLLKSGRGPGESTNLLKLFNGFGNNICACVANETIYMYDIGDILAGKSQPYRTIKLPNGHNAYSSIAITESELLYVGRNPTDIKENKTLYCSYNYINNETRYFGSLPAIDPNVDNYPTNDFTIQTIYQGEPMCRPDGNKLVVPYYYSLGFEIIDISDNKVETSKLYTVPDVDIIEIPELCYNVVKRKENSLVGFLDIRCTQDYFYLLYSGKNFGHPTYNQGNIILKYDWKGCLQKKYILDREIYSFCLSDNEDYFICICRNNLDSSVLCYQL